MDSGSYPGRVLNVIDLGLQVQRPFQGEDKKPAYEIMLTYEFADAFMLDEDGEEISEKPRALSESFPLYSLNSERATSTKRYNTLDPEHVHEGDFAALIGSPVMITVVQNPGNGKHKGRIFENIAGITPMRSKDADKLTELVNEPVVFDLDTPDLDAYKGLPEWIQKRITANLEFEGSALARLLASAPPKNTEEEAENTQPTDPDDAAPF
jgi:hypothetical protein